MNNNIAISVENLSKKYQLGELERYYTFRDTLANIVKAPFRKLLSYKNGSSPDSRITKSESSNPDYIWALKNVSFKVNHGEVIGIIGRNGAGKSTLLKLLSRITAPTEGTIKINGSVGSLIEIGTGFHPELTGRENIYLNGSILGMSRMEINNKFDEIVAFSEIEKFLDTPVKRYSSGMNIRLAFAVTAHLNHDILVIDEVLAVGDAKFQQKCIGAMGDVSKQGRTILFVSHQLNHIKKLTENCIWLEQGKIEKIGNTFEVVNNYEKSFSKIADLLGNEINNVNRLKAMIRGWKINANQLNKSNIIEKEGPLHITFYISVKTEIFSACLNIFLYNKDNLLVWGDSINNLSLKQGNYKVNYSFSSLPLMPGAYFWKISLYDTYEFIDSSFLTPELHINTKSYTNTNDDMTGLLNISYKQEIIHNH